MKSTINQESGISMGQKPTESYKISDNLSIILGDCSTKNDQYFTFDFVSSDDHPSFESYMSRDKLRGLAVFILNYLENN